MVRVGQVVSCLITATRGITAGSGFATTEMRRVFIRLIDRACRAFPSVWPTVFVDDLSTELSGRTKQVAKDRVGFGLMVCNAVTMNGM